MTGGKDQQGLRATERSSDAQLATGSVAGVISMVSDAGWGVLGTLLGTVLGFLLSEISTWYRNRIVSLLGVVDSWYR